MVMKGGYETLVWVADMDGSRYACFADDIGQDSLHSELLFNVEDYSRCLDINRIVRQRTGLS